KIRIQREAGRSRDHLQVQIKIYGVAVVVSRLLEVDAVRVQMLGHLFEQDRQPFQSPAPRVAETRKRGAQVQQPESFAGKMGVWTKVMRQIRRYVTAVSDQRLEEASHES